MGDPAQWQLLNKYTVSQKVHIIQRHYIKLQVEYTNDKYCKTAVMNLHGQELWGEMDEQELLHQDV